MAGWQFGTKFRQVYPFKMALVDGVDMRISATDDVGFEKLDPILAGDLSSRISWGWSLRSLVNPRKISI